MAEILIEETTGSSKRSLTHALADAIRSALRNIDTNHQLNISVIIEGYTLENGKYEVSVKVLIMDVTLEKDKAFQETQKELTDRLDASQNLSEQMFAAAYARPIYDHTQPIDALEQRMEKMSEHSDQFNFNGDQDNIILIAPQTFHDQMRVDYNEQFPDNHLKSDAPTLDLGGGSSSGVSEDKDAA